MGAGWLTCGPGRERVRVRADERASRAGACACEAVGRRAGPRARAERRKEGARDWAGVERQERGRLRQAERGRKRKERRRETGQGREAESASWARR